MDKTFTLTSVAGIVAPLALASGCAANGGEAATHYWESSEPVAQVRYNRDHTVCSATAGIDGAAAALQPEVPSFDAYSACMVRRGYTLQTY